MTERIKIEELLAKVEAATGPDRKIDASLFALFAPGADAHPWPKWIEDQEQGRDDFLAIQRYTASIDAALALVERLLPGRDIDLEIRELMSDGVVKRVTDATIYAQYQSGGKPSKAYGDSPPLAIIAALLRALLASPAP